MRPAAVPRFPGFRLALGPGIVWLALAQGSGELVWWPYIVAKYGLGFLCLLIPAALLQYPLTYEIGRYTLLTGESIWAGFIRLHRGFAWALWILMAVSFLWFGAFASAGGTALAALTQFPAGWSARGQSLFWGYLAITVCFIALVGSKVIYRTIERIMWAVAVLTLLGLLVACTHPEVRQHLPAFTSGLVTYDFSLPRAWDPSDATKLLTALAFTGLGGFWTLFYSFWLKEKGAGMAVSSGHITGLTGQRGTVRDVSVVPDSSRASASNWHKWRTYLKADAGIGVFGNLLTTLLTCLLAYALLFPKGLLPQAWELAVVQAEFFEVSWGAFGRALFLLVAAAFLADTWLSTVDAVARTHGEMTRRLVPGASRRSARWWYFFFLYLLTAVTAMTMLFNTPGTLIMITAVIGFAGTVIYSFAILWLNHHLLPLSLPAYARPSRLAYWALSLTCVTYLGLLTVYLFSWLT